MRNNGLAILSCVWTEYRRLDEDPGLRQGQKKGVTAHWNEKELNGNAGAVDRGDQTTPGWLALAGAITKRRGELVLAELARRRLPASRSGSSDNG